MLDGQLHVIQILFPLKTNAIVAHNTRMSSMSFSGAAAPQNQNNNSASIHPLALQTFDNWRNTFLPFKAVRKFNEFIVGEIKIYEFLSSSLVLARPRDAEKEAAIIIVTLVKRRALKNHKIVLLQRQHTRGAVQ